MEYIFEITPCPAPRMVRSDKWNRRPIVSKYFGFCNHLRCLAKVKGLHSLPGTIDNLTFNIPMPASWSQKKRTAMEGKPHCQTPDLDNLVKGLLDALCSSDQHIHSIGSLSKVWAIEGSIRISFQDYGHVLTKSKKQGALTLNNNH